MPAEDEQKYNMSAHREEQEALAKEEARIFIEKAITDLGPTGAYDSEPNLLRRLLEDLNNNRKTVQEARTEAAAIKARRSHYH
ncbi:MAG: hypothetical protein M1383_00440 [Patescibacteria group bacterium]|nr:hypothetical protein [Patescibacteria group bacterium]